MVPPRWVRRLLSPLYLVGESALAVLLAGVAVLGLLTWPIDRRLRASRLAAMCGLYLVAEVVALVVLFAIWLARPGLGRARWDEANRRVLVAVLGLIVRAGGPVMGFRVEVEEPPDLYPFDRDTPALVLARHGGLGDSYSLAWLLAGRYRRRPRVVLKSVLCWEPLLDVLLSRLGACFVPPEARRQGALAGRIGDLARDMGGGEALLLFPEGGNWTPARRLRAIGRLWRDHKPAAARAAALMEHVLAPQPGGVLACLGARPELPVVIVAHTGLDRLTTAAAAWAAVPFRAPMVVRWWLAASAPDGDEELVAWLTSEWAVVDQWIDAHHPGPGNVSRRTGSPGSAPPLGSAPTAGP